jgi:uncharacterized damage-inducible protein DinB
MEPSLWQELYDYNFWANRRVWESIMALDEAFFDKPLGGDRRSIRIQCIHILEVEYWWVHFLHTGVVEFLDDEVLLTRADVRAAWDDVEVKVKGWVAQMTPASLERTVRPDFWKDPWSVKAWQGLMQVLVHSTDHRAQLLDAVRELGGPTDEQDYLTYLHERAMSKPGRPIRPA